MVSYQGVSIYVFACCGCGNLECCSGRQGEQPSVEGIVINVKRSTVGIDGKIVSGSVGGYGDNGSYDTSLAILPCIARIQRGAGILVVCEKLEIQKE